MRILVLRPKPGASETLRKVREIGLEAVATPLFEIERVEWRPPDASAFDGLLLTSANAVRHGGEQLDELQALGAYCVGEATAEAARAAGFDITAVGDSGVDRLLASIEPDLHLLHLCGEDRRTPANAQQQITPIVAYRSRRIEAPDLSAAPGSVALIHSPRAGRRFGELARDRGTISIAAISPAAAEAVGEGWRIVEAADRPSDEALLALAARLCNNAPPK